jgi:phosphoglycolate phosphatase-like HAD superfamily hydrolase
MAEEAPKEKVVRAPQTLKPLENAENITTLVIDADNTLWNWAEMHAYAIQEMAARLQFVTGIPLPQIQASIKRVYKAAGTMDFSMLVQCMDIMHDYAIQHAETFREDPALSEELQPTQEGDKPDSMKEKRIAMHYAMQMANLVETARKAYDAKKGQIFRTYELMGSVMEAIVRAKIQIVLLTDAPTEKTIRRLKHFGLDKYIEKLFGQKLPKLEFLENPTYTEGELRQDELRQIYEMIRMTAPNVDNTIQRAMVSMGRYAIKANVTTLQAHERKPFISLATRLKMSTDEVSKHVVVLGDNPDKDVMLAIRNNCPGIYAGYGQIDEPTADILRQFGTPEVVSRNLSAGDARFQKVKKNPHRELVDWASSQQIEAAHITALQQLVIDRRLRLARVAHPLQILDRLGIQRPGKEPQEQLSLQFNKQN